MCDLIAVTNRHLCKGDFLDRIRLLVDCRVPKILLREKDLLPEAYEELSHKVLEICRATDTKCILHNYVDAALHEKADAIHLPLQTALTEKEKLTAFSHLGISTHSIEQVRKAEDIGAAYVTYGHVFATDCKKGVTAKRTYITCRDYSTDRTSGICDRWDPYRKRKIGSCSRSKRCLYHVNGDAGRAKGNSEIFRIVK